MVDQVVNPKILSVVEPEVESVMVNILGMEKPVEPKGWYLPRNIPLW